MKKQALFCYLLLLSSSIFAQVTEIPMLVTTPSSHPEGFVLAGEKLFFSASTQTLGREMWSSDGTESGTQLVRNVLPGSGSGIRSLKRQHQPASLNDALYFISANEDNSENLWVTRGAEANMELVKEGLHLSSNLTACGSYMFFLSDDLTHGLELWKTDGTEAGTIMIKDINPGGGSAFVDSTSYLTAVDGTLYFRANNGVNGYELWKSDGTVDGTVMVSDVYAGENSSSPSSLYNFNGVLIFTASAATSYYELWKSDGTAGGTVLVKDIYPGIPGSSPAGFAHNNNTLYFAATTTQGREVWTSDGTEAGTTLLKDIKPGAASSFPVNFISHGDRVYFTTSDATLSKFLWRTDGTPEGTVSVSNRWLVYDIADFVSLNGELFFTMTEEYHGTRLYGLTAGGTTPVLLSPHRIEYPRYKRGESIFVPDVFNYFSFSFDLPKLVAFNNAIYFSNADHRGRELWKISSATSTPELVKDIADQPAEPLQPAQFAVAESSIFVATESGELYWVDKQAPANQFRYMGKFSSIDHLTAVGSGVAFIGELPVLYPVYIPEPTPLLYTGPDKAIDLSSHGIYGLTKTLLTKAGDLLLFVRATSPGNRVLQYYNTITTEMGELGRVCYGDGGCNHQPWNFTRFKNTYYYISNSIYYKYSNSYLQSSIKSLNGTAAIDMDAIVPEINAQITELAATNDLLFFTGQHREHGLQLFSSTGNGNTKTMIPGPSAPGNLTAHANKVIFTAREKELWISDGSEAGTYPLVQFAVSPKNLKSTKLGVFFEAWDEARGWELWITKGTAISTRHVKDISAGPESSSMGNFTTFAGKLFFTASDGTNGIELWQSDGTSSGTAMVADGIASSEPSQLAESDGTLYFLAYNTPSARSLYSYRPNDEVFLNEDVPLCLGGQTEISFFTHDMFNADNEFTVELSDANGSFETPTVIGNVKTAEPGPIVVAVPAAFQPEEGEYEIRIRSSSPSTIIANAAHPVQFLKITPAISPTNSGIGLRLTTETYDRYQWNLDNQAIHGATENEFTPRETGSYTVQVTTKGCVSTSAAYHVVVTGVENMYHAGTVYPNPAKDVLIIKHEVPHPPIETTYTLYDQHGKRFVPERSGTASGDTILSVQSYNSGLYLLEILSGKQRSVQKIIIGQ